MRSIRRFLALCLLLSAAPLAADEGAWTPIGPEGGTVNALAAAPSRPAIVYAGLNYSGVYKSTDRGRTWSPTGLRQGFVTDVAVDAANPNRVYAGTGTGLFASSDGGATWAPLEAVPGTALLFPLVEVHPRNPAILFVTDGQLLYRSADQGQTWTALPDGPSWVRSLAFAPGRPSIVYAGALDGLWKSLDTGRTWRRITEEVPGASTLAVDPRSHRVVYAGHGSEVQKSTDGGLTWTTSLRGGNNNIPVGALVFAPTDPTFLYASRDGVLRSRNGGRTWTRVGAGLRGRPGAALIAARYGLLAGTSQGVFASRDRALTFIPSQRGLNAVRVFDLAIDAEAPARLFATTLFGIFVTHDRGTAWQLLGNVPRYDFGAPQQLRIDPVDPEMLYTPVNEGIARSTDGGQTWTGVQQFPCVTPEVLFLDPLTPSTLYSLAGGSAAPTCGGVPICLFRRSLDAGLNWECTESHGLLLGIDPFTSAVYMGGREFWSSTDNGTTWTRLAEDQGRTVLSLAPSLVVPGTLWAGSFGEVGRSRDGGRTWTFFSTGLPAAEWLALTADPVDPEVVYAASLITGVFKSTDAGETWSPVGTWPAWSQLRGSVAVDPADPSILYVGTDNSSVLTFDQED